MYESILHTPYLHILVLISYLIVQCMVMDHLKSNNIFHGLHNVTLQYSNTEC